MESILLRQREKSLPIDATISQRIIVRRKHLWEDALHRLELESISINIFAFYLLVSQL